MAILKIFFPLLIGITLLGGSSTAFADNDTPTKEEKDLATVPKIRFFDWRLGKIYAKLARQYKHLYGHAAADGYIFPNERRDLLFQRRHMNRIITIDRRNHKILSLYKKHRRKFRFNTRHPRKMSKDDREFLKLLIKHKIRYEKMIRRFACRYIPNYKKRFRHHCKKSKDSF